MAGTYRDFIPAEEDPGAQGNGFQDYVAPREPQVQTIVEEIKPLVPEVEVEETPALSEEPKESKKK